MTDTDWVAMTDQRRKRIEAALALYAAAEQWRRNYFRAQLDPETLDMHNQRAYDECQTNFGDDAFELLMDYTAPLD